MAERNNHEESESKRKCLRNKYATLEGQLIAVSHIIHANPSLLLIELSDGQTVHHIAITDQKHKALRKHLVIGGSYRFTHLKLNRIRYSDGGVVVVSTSTATSSFIFYSNVDAPIPKPKCDSIFYVGVVTGAVPSLGLYELDNRRILYLSFLIGHCNIPLPEVGKKICIYNAHFWRNTESKRCALVLCGRSCITIKEAQTKLDIPNSKIDLIEDYGTVWMNDVLEAMQQKFSRDFIVQNINARHSVPIFQHRILLQYIGFHYTTNITDKRHLTREFLSQPHECVFTKSEKLSHENIFTLDDAKQEMEKCLLKNLQMSTWNYHVNHSDVNTIVLIGFLSTRNGCWMLSDATGTFPCIVTGNEEELRHICNSVIFIKRYRCIMEAFKGKKPKILTYLQFNAKDAVILSANDTKDESKNKNTGGEKYELQHCVKSQSNSDTNQNKGIYEKQKTGEENISNGFSCLMRVLHKSTPAMIPANDMPVCCILAVYTDTKHEQKKLFLVLTGKLVCVHPVLDVGKVYSLSTPGQQICKVLEKCCKLKSLSQVLPDVIGAVLPEDSRIFPMDGQRPATSLSNNIYRVDDKSFIEEAGQREMVDVEGIITDRLHTKIKFDDEKHPSETEFFGVPDYQNIVLKVKGTSGKNNEVTLYLNNWGSRAYPLGLVPGAQIQACFVAKFTAKASARTYFQATELTRIDVLQLAQENVAKNDAIHWPKPCILTKEANQAAPGAVLCGLISSMKVWKITAEVVCQYCAEAFQGGKCTKCIFSANAPQLLLSANCFLEDAFGEVVLLVQRSQAYQLFERPSTYWNVLARVITKEHNKISISDSDVPKTTSERILHCMLSALNNKPCHWLVLARKMRPQSSDQRNALFCMELEKPKPSFMQNLLKETSCLPSAFMEQHNISTS